MDLVTRTASGKVIAGLLDMDPVAEEGNPALQEGQVFMAGDFTTIIRLLPR